MMVTHDGGVLVSNTNFSNYYWYAASTTLTIIAMMPIIEREVKAKNHPRPLGF